MSFDQFDQWTDVTFRRSTITRNKVKPAFTLTRQHRSHRSPSHLLPLSTLQHPVQHFWKTEQRVQSHLHVILQKCGSECSIERHTNFVSQGSEGCALQTILLHSYKTPSLEALYLQLRHQRFFHPFVDLAAVNPVLPSPFKNPVDIDGSRSIIYVPIRSFHFQLLFQLLS
jgi:hypothetical protein